MRRAVWGRRTGLSRATAIVLVFALLTFAAAMFGALSTRQSPIVGRAAAIDGDTLRIGGARIRLTGLDAVELDQTCTDGDGREWPCGMAARRALAELVSNQRVSCERGGRDVYGRILARCSRDETDIGARMVRDGWAVMDFAYVAEEAEARAAHRGIWSGTFVAPAEWRRDHGTANPGPWEWIRSWFQ